MKFTYNPRIIEQLGTELITSDEIAITELIKNAYDAKAKIINIHFADSFDQLDKKKLKQPLSFELKEVLNGNLKTEKDNKEIAYTNLIVIEDDGKGMSKKKIKDGFFVVGTTLKKDEKKKEKEKILLGDKGIGRLSAQRLSPILVLESTSEEDDEINIISIRWADFIKSTEAETIDLFLPKKKKCAYTRLWLIGTRNTPVQFDEYFEVSNIIGYDLFGKPTLSKKPLLKLKGDLQHALSFLFSPFNNAKLSVDINFRYNDKDIQVNFHSDTLKVAETEHTFEFKKNTLKLNLKVKPWFLQRIHKKLLGKKLYQDWVQDPKFYGELLNKYSNRFEVSLSQEYTIEYLLSSVEKILYSNKSKGSKTKRKTEEYKKEIEKAKIEFAQALEKFLPIEGKVFSFKRDAQLLRMAVDSALAQNILASDSNINEVRTFLDIHNGIKLYRNNYRIGTIGNKDDDWVKLQQERTKGQQFYRFELGNIIGYVNLNDPFQKYIYETSSRQHINDNQYKKALHILIDFIFNHKFYEFNRIASEIAKEILHAEKLIPVNNEEEIRNENENARNIIEIAKTQIKSFKKVFEKIRDHIEMDTQEKVVKVKKALQSIKEETLNFTENADKTLTSFNKNTQIMSVAENRVKEIETEAYNNYKLMANGLVTEVITHELHSLVAGKQNKELNLERFENIKNFLFVHQAYDLNNTDLHPIKTSYSNLLKNLNKIGSFYQFLEKTFLYKGDRDELVTQNVIIFLQEFYTRFENRLIKNKIELDYKNVDIDIEAPQGTLVHLFYNLIENSIYWIQERQKRARSDKFYQIDEADKISITKINNYVFHYYDTGTGVLKQYQHTLFQPLVSGKHNGRGMGLYIVHKFLESFGASIILLNDENPFGNKYIFEINFRNNQKE